MLLGSLRNDVIMMSKASRIRGRKIRESGECYDACFFYDEDVCPECVSNGKDKIYKILKLKQL